MALAGAFSIDITPTPPVDLNGYILRFGRAKGIHDRLNANFLYVEHAEKKMLLVSLDILTIDTETATRLREQVARELGMERDGILFAAIHTHSAVGKPYLRNVGEASETWQKDFEQKMVQGCRAARERAVEAEFVAYEAFSGVGVNRRKETRGMDPHTPFIVIKRGKEIIAWLINYNCHPVCLTEDNLLISADYVHYLREFLYGQVQQRFPVLFFNGGSGDVDPKRRGSFDDARFTGEKLGEEILLAYQAYRGEKFEPFIDYRIQELEIPYGWQPSLKEAEENLAQHTTAFEKSENRDDKKINGAFLLWAEEILDRVKQNKLPKSLKTEIYYFRMGKAVFIALPLEIFSSISLKIREMIDKYYCFVVSYGNGYSGYLADKVAFHEGGYEVEQWHKYAGILPQVTHAEDIFFETLVKVQKKIDLIS